MKHLLLSLTAVLAFLSTHASANTVVVGVNHVSGFSATSFDADHLIMAKKKGKKKLHKKAK